VNYKNPLPHETILDYRSWKHFNSEKLSEDLEKINYEYIDEADGNTSALIYTIQLKVLINKHLPLKSMKISARKLDNWVTEDLRKMFFLRDYYSRKFKVTNEKSYEVLYKKLRNECSKECKRLKKQFYSSKIEANKNNPKTLWKTLRTIIPTKKSIVHNNYSKSRLRAEEICKYFEQGPSKIITDAYGTAPQNEWTRGDHTTQDHIGLPVITEELILKTLDSLDEDKASGYDDISVKILKRAKSQIVKPLTQIIQNIFRERNFPLIWKISRVSAIPKNPFLETLENLRPISVLSILSKVLEKILATHLLDYLVENNILSDKQFGFRPKSSCVDANLSIQKTVIESINKKLKTAVVQLDLRKAFDTVDHEILISKLFKIGLSKEYVQLLKSYLQNRHFFVKFAGENSNLSEASLGVPQGSNLGPILFLIYINDLAQLDLKGDIFLYADDASIVYKGANFSQIQENVSLDFNKIDKCLSANRMVLNLEKTKFISFGHRPNVSDILLVNNLKICRVQSLKILGVIFDEKLNFKTNIENVTKKLNKKVGLLSRLRYFLPSTTLKLLFNSLILPHFLYCLEVWGFTYDTHLDQLELIHKKCIRIITKSSYLAHTRELYERNQILPFPDLIRNVAFKYIYKNLHESTPTITRNFFRYLPHNIQTRKASNKCLYVPVTHFECVKRSIFYNGTSRYNLLPKSIRDSSSFSKFKRDLKLHLHAL